jgi:preprotein translocase subunit SecF
VSLLGDLYSGNVSYDFLRRRKLWYTISAVLVAVSIISFIVRGFTLGIDFKGGESFQFRANHHTVEQVRSAVESAGVADPTVQSVGSSDIRVITPPLSQSQEGAVLSNLSKTVGVSRTDLNPSVVGSSWGSEITGKAVQGLVVFLVLVIALITVAFQWKMAVAAIVALLHDLIITAGIYSLVGFEVTPSTVIALLTILGFSLYDTVVVFDKVRENTRDLSRVRTTFGEAANLALDQTLMRSINTSLIALMPVAALLFIGAFLLGAGTLKDLALAQFVGLAAGAYSSIFVATPLFFDLKSREPEVVEHDRRVVRSLAKARSRAGEPAVVGADGGSLGLADGDADALVAAESDEAPVRSSGSAPSAARSGARRASGGSRRPGTAPKRRR